MITEEIRDAAKLVKYRGEVKEFQSVGKIYQEELRRAIRIHAEEVVDSLQGMGTKALDRINYLIDSPDQQVATKNAHYVIDHLIGKATQKSISTVRHVSIDVIAD